MIDVPASPSLYSSHSRKELHGQRTLVGEFHEYEAMSRVDFGMRVSSGNEQKATDPNLAIDSTM